MTAPRQNRVLPTGGIVADPARGLFMGNRGILHDESGQLGASRWKHPHWVCCRLEFKGRRRPVMAPGAYTELFFLDEAVALAAGHRPCAECRRAAFEAYRDAWELAFGTRPKAGEIDRVLHDDRVLRNRRQIRHDQAFGDLPAGAFFLFGDAPLLKTDAGALAFSPEGYRPATTPDADGIVSVLTPRASVAVLAAGYRPELHPTAAV